MKKSNDRKTNMILTYIGDNNLEDINNYLNRLQNDNFTNFNDFNGISNYFNTELYSNISNEEIELIRYYTGMSYKEINAILRDNWNYETNGLLTEEKKKEFRKIAYNISSAIDRSLPLRSNIITYRGTNLEAFKSYGINSLEDLLKLKDEYYYESAFTSTSLIRENSFFDRPLEYHNNCNIEITYIVPKDSNDGIALLDDNTSYSKVQSEYLLNCGSLFKIVDVKLSEDKRKAYITMILIPKKIWNKDIKREEKESYNK